MYPVPPAIDWRKLLLSTPEAARRISLVSEGGHQLSDTERTVFKTSGQQKTAQSPEAGFRIVFGSRIRIRIRVKSWIRIRIKVKSWIRIRIKVKSWIRIRIEVIRMQTKPRRRWRLLVWKYADLQQGGEIDMHHSEWYVLKKYNSVGKSR
jgi:hypothetical protein